jgi:hypothetical protein
MALTVTLRELVSAVSDYAQSEAEVVATVVHMINSGQVRLRGNIRDARIDFAPDDGHRPLA